MGVPLPAIRIKMTAEGVEPDGLEVSVNFLSFLFL